MRTVLLQMIRRSSAIIAAMLLLAAQTFGPLSFLLPTASAAEVCEVDVQGANDEPGQKDLTQMCSDTATSGSGFITIKWNWDDTDWSGNNSGDGCALFDTDGDGFANYSLCAVVKGSPAAIIDTRVYSCSDAKADRCTNPNQDNTITSSCVTAITATQPFAAGSATPNDTTATCTIQLTDVGGAASAELIDVCSYPSQQPNSDPSDCIIATTKATVEVVKQIVPDTDTGKFDLFIDGVKHVDDGGDNSSTGPKIVDDTKDVIVKEEPGLNTLLTNYTTVVNCINQDGQSVASGSPSGTGSRQVTISAQSIAKGDTIVCTFTNTRSNGSITLIKNVINDNGGTATVNSFGLTIGGNGVNSGQTLSLPPGNYAINETLVTGYQFVSITGTGCPSQLGGNVVLGSNQNVTCTITNNDVAGQLRVIKNVVNDNGGNAVAADFTLSVNAIVRTQGQYFSANAGSYTVTEAGPSGYTMTGLACVDDTTQQAVSHPVSLALAQSVTCTVTNNDNAPGLTVVKQVINNDGGDATADDFVLRLNGNALLSPVMSNGNLTATYAVSNPQSNTVYTVTEDAFAGYFASAVSCVDNTSQQSVSHPVTLSEGQSVTCTINNNDIAPKLTVVKTVVNDDGGDLLVSDFPLYVDALQVDSGVENTFSAGLHVVSEVNQPGYTAGTWGGDCDVNGNITLAVGGVYTCTITNDDQPASIKVTKIVVNDNGGNAVIADFTLKVNTTTVVSGVNNTFPGNASYTISETNVPDGYTQTSLVCNDDTGQAPVPANNPFTAELGHSYECVVTNDDTAPGLTVVKKIINDNGGQAVVADFDIELNNSDLSFGSGQVNGDETTYSATPTVSANTDYTLSELDLTGYAEGTWSCTDGTQGTGLEATVNLNEGENVTCTITNDDKSAELILIKNVINDDGGNAVIDDFTPTVNDVDATWGTHVVDAGNYLVSEKLPLPAGYQLNGVSCYVTGSPATGVSQTVRLENGTSRTCEVTNDDIAPTLTLVKNVTNDNGGTATAGDWTLTADAFVGTDISGNGEDGVVDAEAVANLEYTLTESGPSGYEVSVDWTCDGGNFNEADNTLTLDEGDDVTCQITNDDIEPKLTIIKKINGIESEEKFDFSGDLGDLSLGHNESHSGDDLSAGTYEVTEAAKIGWQLGSVHCFGTENWDPVFDDNDLVGVTVDLALADDVTCKFKNDKLGEANGHKFEDVNGNGNWDEGEPGLDGWTIQLFSTCDQEVELTLALLDNLVEQDCEEALVDETVTAEDGSYSFENILFGDYKVCEVLQSGWLQTHPFWTEDGCHYFSISRSGQVEDDLNFGNFEKASVSGFKFNDANNSGAFEEGEEKLSGWTIKLTIHCETEEEIVSLRTLTQEDCEDETLSTVTDQNGNYSFGDLTLGNYTVCEVLQDGWMRTYPSGSDCHEFSIESSGQNVTANFGNKAKEPGRVLGELVDTGNPLTLQIFVGATVLISVLGVTILSRKSGRI